LLINWFSEVAVPYTNYFFSHNQDTLIQSKSLFEAVCFPDNNRLIFNATCDNILLIITVICYPSVIQHLINDNKQW